MTHDPNTIVSDDDRTNQNITKDGQAVTVKMLLMDGRQPAADAAAARDAAYDAYVRRISDGWRSALTPNPDDLSDADACPEADVRDNAYDSYVKSLGDAWRSTWGEDSQ